MTTAHRPTWHPVTGGKDQGGNRVTVATRQYSSKDLPGHTTLKYRQLGQGSHQEVEGVDYRQQLIDKESEIKKLRKIEESDDNQSEESENEGNSESDSSDFSESEMRREIDKIKQERLEKLVKDKSETMKLEESSGNPLLDNSEFSLKKKWTEETIFRNQSRDEPKEKMRFVNDTVRSDFHRKILKKYIM